MFSFIRKKPVDYFSAEEKQLIIAAIQQAEKTTSGEVRVFVEQKCAYVNALDRAKEVFVKLNMKKTVHQNAVLVYVALKDRQLAIFGDEGIHQKVGQEFWKSAIKKMLQNFHQDNYATGIANIVLEIGHALHEHFPYDQLTDKNELPDDIVFGQ